MRYDHGCIASTTDGVTVHVKVQPRSKRNAIEGIGTDGLLRVALTAPPVEGAANSALVALIADRCGVPKSAVIITAGQSSRTKSLHIHGLSLAQAEKALLPQG